ncbi:PREDICTED: uncharacterized protein LOC104778546 [Camelina sativa]|uniref:Uncharacterized protein LOC104778546 n=1 Tax=Camelina sativa TaxID=90675 RepID=A0ABM0YIB5_CAMSA|nr:PREDICTED: uncharacterized protein LOC104778546 [Camelina sativa]
MDPKSSDVDTVEEANLETPRSLYTIEELNSRLEFERFIKRFAKIGFKVLEKDEISTSSEEEDEDEDKDSVESDQEWDVDSFEGCEYESDPEESEDWRRYVRQCYKSEGFDVPRDCVPKRTSGRICCGFCPVELDEYFSPPDLTGRQYMENMLKVVIAKHNETKKKNLVLDHIVRAVVLMGGKVKAYITFMAKETPEGELVEYQGKAEWKVWQRNFHPLLCRPASEQRQLP